MIERSAGFTLIELIAGIVVFSIAMVLVVGVLSPQVIRGIEPIYQVRATELAQSYLNEISSKAYDESAIPLGTVRCNEDINDNGDLTDIGEAPCSPVLGPEEASREAFDDVDDYQGLSQTSEQILNALGQPIAASDGTHYYQGFQVDVFVAYDGDSVGVALQDAKRITVRVTSPSGQALDFATYRYNY